MSTPEQFAKNLVHRIIKCYLKILSNNLIKSLFLLLCFLISSLYRDVEEVRGIDEFEVKLKALDDDDFNYNSNCWEGVRGLYYCLYWLPPGLRSHQFIYVSTLVIKLLNATLNTEEKWIDKKNTIVQAKWLQVWGGDCYWKLLDPSGVGESLFQLSFNQRLSAQECKDMRVNRTDILNAWCTGVTVWMSSLHTAINGCVCCTYEFLKRHSQICTVLDFVLNGLVLTSPRIKGWKRHGRSSLFGGRLP